MYMDLLLWNAGRVNLRYDYSKMGDLNRPSPTSPYEDPVSISYTFASSQRFTIALTTDVTLGILSRVYVIDTYTKL